MKKRCIVAMSGGVDSSVAALVMKKKGYDVIGVFLKCWTDTKEFSGECSWREERRNAIAVCNHLKIPLITIDAEKEYRKYVVDEMFKEYKKGITPNPDVLCNEVVKFPFLFREAKKLKSEIIVTGHFTRIKKRNGKYHLYRAKDETKDQSYFLYRLKEEDLKKVVFPIGEYTKKEVRQIAKKEGFLNHEKKSTVGICFIGKIPMKKFLSSRIPNKKGNILNEKGEIIGTHDGIYYYTIGQRLGPRFDLHIKKESDNPRQMSRWYIAKKDLKKNTLTVAPKNSPILLKKEMMLNDFHLITISLSEFKKMCKEKKRFHVRIRHVGELIPAKIIFKEKNVHITLKKKLTGVSDGQALIIYSGKKVIGGGVIQHSF